MQEDGKDDEDWKIGLKKIIFEEGRRSIPHLFWALTLGLVQYNRRFGKIGYIWEKFWASHPRARLLCKSNTKI